MGGFFNSTERPAELAERDDLFLLFFVQDIAHIDGGYSSRPSHVLIAFSLAGFQVTTIGRPKPASDSGSPSERNVGTGSCRFRAYWSFPVMVLSRRLRRYKQRV